MFDLFHNVRFDTKALSVRYYPNPLLAPFSKLKLAVYLLIVPATLESVVDLVGRPN